MISLGGVIGAGLFIGSGTLINTAGPGSIISYAFAGLLVILVMRMLGEMSTANPSSGSFATYAREALGYGLDILLVGCTGSFGLLLLQ